MCKIRSALWSMVCLPVQIGVDLSALDVLDMAWDVFRNPILYLAVLVLVMDVLFQTTMSGWVSVHYNQC